MTRMLDAEITITRTVTRQGLLSQHKPPKGVRCGTCRNIGRHHVKCPLATPPLFRWGEIAAIWIAPIATTFGLVTCSRCKARRSWLNACGHAAWCWIRWDGMRWAKRPKVPRQKAARGCKGCGKTKQEDLSHG